MSSSTPRFKHDCNDCKFLGQEGKFDAYFCQNCDKGTIILRYDSEGEKYASYPRFVLSENYRSQSETWNIAHRLIQGL